MLIRDEWIKAPYRRRYVSESKQNMLLDVDSQGNICAITVEQASERADIPKFSYEQVAA